MQKLIGIEFFFVTASLLQGVVTGQKACSIMKLETLLNQICTQNNNKIFYLQK